MWPNTFVYYNLLKVYLFFKYTTHYVKTVLKYGRPHIILLRFNMNYENRSICNTFWKGIFSWNNLKIAFLDCRHFSHFSFVLFQQNIFESFLVEGTRVRMTFEWIQFKIFCLFICLLVCLFVFVCLFWCNQQRTLLFDF